MVMPNEHTPDRHLQNTARIPDACVAEMAQQAQMHTASGLADSGMSAVKLLAADTLCKLEPALCRKLNAHLKGSGFSPFEHVGSAVLRLLQLEESGKSAKAQRLKMHLTAFADAHHGSIECLMHWPDLMCIKKERDAFTHALGAPTLQSIIADNHPLLTTTRTWQAPVEN